MKTTNVSCKGFTLIELLIVVAIIGILAAIAVPNFLNAQVKAKVARIQSELRNYSSALESYRLDHNTYPLEKTAGRGYMHDIPELTTPVSYVATVRNLDPFKPEKSMYVSDPLWIPTYQYLTYWGPWGIACHPDWLRMGYVMSSYGPDKYQDNVAHYPYYKNHPDQKPYWLGGDSRGQTPNDMVYDVSNGIISAGDIAGIGGDIGAGPLLGGR